MAVPAPLNSSAQLTVRCIYDPDRGRWSGSVPRYPGILAEGRSLQALDRRIRDALVALPDAPAIDSTVELAHDVELPEVARGPVVAALDARRALEEAQAQANWTTVHAVFVLVYDGRMSFRDAGEVLGLSHQRIQQLVDGAWSVVDVAEDLDVDVKLVRSALESLIPEGIHVSDWRNPSFGHQLRTRLTERVEAWKQNGVPEKYRRPG